MRNKLGTIILIILLSLITIILVGFLYLGISGKFKFLKGIKYRVIQNEIYNEVFSEEFNEINIKSKAGEILINSTSDNSYKVVVNGKRSDDFKLSNNNNVLDISYNPKTCKGLCFNIEIGRIELFIPESYGHKIKIENNYGDIYIGEFENALISIDEDAGNINIKESKEVLINNDYGNIKIGKSQNVDIDESAGNVKIGEVDEAVVNNDYGDVEIDTINGRADIKTDCGDINIKNLYLTKNSTIANDLGDIRIGNTNEIFIDAKTDLGSVKINNNYNKSDIKLTIENDCGDIKVNN